MIFKLTVALCTFLVLIVARPDKDIAKDDELAFVENVDDNPGKSL